MSDIIQLKDPESTEKARDVAVVKEDVDRLRIVLDVTGDDTEHDVLIERREGAWMVFVHANGGDPEAIVRISRDNLRIEDGAGTTLYEIHVQPVAADKVGAGKECDVCGQGLDKDHVGRVRCPSCDGSCPCCSDQ